MESSEKEFFLKNTLFEKLKLLNEKALPKWGVLSPLQMIEHLTESTLIACGTIAKTSLLTKEQTEKARVFMLTDKPFKENTKNIEMPEIPLPPLNTNIENAVRELQVAIDNFFKVFSSNKEKKILNPFFGYLNYQEWVHLLHKHFSHHLKQFDLIK